jgi:glycerol-3-phosphate dehydrogenase
VGGGINGTGAARDLALRGLKVALLEKRDLGAGATGGSSGMIHGGARYLTHEPAVTKQSCTDAGAIRRIASHMMFRIPFIFPMLRGYKVEGMGPGLALHMMDSLLYAYDLYQPRKGGLPHQRLKRDEALALEPGLNPAVTGALTWDEWGVDAIRLCLANALSAAEAGAQVHLRHHVTGFVVDEGRVRAVRFVDGATGRSGQLSCRAVLNAAGPWAQGVADRLGAHGLRLRPSKGVHLVVAGRVTNYAIAAQAVDGRSIFLEPWQDLTLIGTTDDDYYGDLDHVQASFDEVSYLLEAVQTVFPSIVDHRIIDTWCGVRPTLWAYGPNEDRLSREHDVIDHRHDGYGGVFSLVGGKLASYRLMASDAVDCLCQWLGHDVPCSTADEPLPGAEGDLEPERWAGEFEVSEMVVRRLMRRHGSRTGRMLRQSRVEGEPPGACICQCEQVLAVEVRHALRAEWARSLGDIMRRTRLGTGPCGGVGCAFQAAQMLARHLGRSPQWAAEQAYGFLNQRFRSRSPALRGFQVRSEALSNARLGLDCTKEPS